MTTAEPACAGDPPELHTYVTVDGARYHIVSFKGERVRVMGDPDPVFPTPEAREQMLRAVVEATGCRIFEEKWVDDALHGKLDCANRLPRKEW